MHTRTLRTLLGAPLLMLALLLTACSGGSPSSSGGVTGTGVTQGPVNGFGSIIVNGIEINTDTATFTRDGVPAGSLTDFRVGEVVRVNWQLADDGVTRIAQDVGYESEIKGEVTDVANAALGEISVLEQPVHITGLTVFKNFTLLTDLLQRDYVEVSGYRADDGSIYASLIELKGHVTLSTSEAELNGVVQNLSLSAFDIGTLTVSNYNVVSGTLSTDAFVRVKGTYSDTSKEIDTADVEVRGDSQAPSVDDGEDVEIEGLITRYTSATDFDVSGLPVTTNGDTEFSDGGTLGLGVHVEVEGTFSGGKLVAEEISFRHETDIELVANLEAVDITASTVKALGMTFLVDALTQLEDDGSTSAPTPFTLSGLNAGTDDVEIRGYRNGPSNLVATRVVRLDESTEVELEGPITALSDPTVTVVDFVLNTNTDAVTYEGGATNQSDFFLFANEGDIVELEGQQIPISGIIDWATLKLDN